MINSNNNNMGDGQDVKDAFDAKKNCIDFRVNKPNTPDCLIGYANRDLFAGEPLYSGLGKKYWATRYRLQELSPGMREKCTKYYKITDRDIVD